MLFQALLCSFCGGVSGATNINNIESPMDIDPAKHVNVGRMTLLQENHRWKEDRTAKNDLNPGWEWAHGG
ncbi:MAG: hypothetical protein J4F28_09490 [Nitrosopumilaceae archaeon]|nr:hypothetical protein [Nitrosopumilaceae archaeon]